MLLCAETSWWRVRFVAVQSPCREFTRDRGQELWQLRPLACYVVTVDYYVCVCVR
jgi:hypothetical protein